MPEFYQRRLVTLSQLVAVPKPMRWDAFTELDTQTLIQSGAFVAGVGLAAGEITCGPGTIWRVRLSDLQSYACEPRPKDPVVAATAGTDDLERGERGIVGWTADHLLRWRMPLVVTFGHGFDPLAFFLYRCGQNGFPVPGLGRTPKRNLLITQHFDLGEERHLRSRERPSLAELAALYRVPLPDGKNDKEVLEGYAALIFVLTVHFLADEGYMTVPERERALDSVADVLLADPRLSAVWSRWLAGQTR